MPWLYLITDDGLLISRHLDGWPPAGVAPWPSPGEEIDWEHIECGEHFEFLHPLRVGSLPRHPRAVEDALHRRLARPRLIRSA